MRPDTCIHFNGINSGTCKANVKYFDVAAPLSQSDIEFHKKNYPTADQAMVGIIRRVPCHVENNVATCPSFQAPTKAELEQFDAEINEILKKTMTARAAIVEYLKSINKLKSNYADKILCPVCGSGTLNFSIAGAYNGHIHAQCTTPKCVQWIE